jgi:HSP20 family molecular chaperone IbpA
VKNSELNDLKKFEMALLYGYPTSNYGFFGLPRVHRPATIWDFEPEPQVIRYVCAKPSPRQEPSKLELKENGENGWIAKLALPGINPANVRVRHDDEKLSVVVRHGYRKLTQSVKLPENADTAKLSADFEDDVLVVVIPKEEKPNEEALKRAEEEAKKAIEKAQEEEKKFQLFLKKLAGPTLSATESETHITNTFDFGEGVNKDDINIEVFKGVLSIHVKIANEYCQYSFKKSIALPDNVKEEDITAVVEESALKVSYPKPSVKKPFKVLISNPPATQSADSETKPEESNQDSVTPTIEEASSTTLNESEIATVTETVAEINTNANPETTNDTAVADFEIVDGTEEDE